MRIYCEIWSYHLYIVFSVTIMFVKIMGYVSCSLIDFFIYHLPKSFNGIYIELNIEFMSEVISALLLYVPFSLTGALKACRVSKQKN